jgi:hypothetical protein
VFAVGDVESWEFVPTGIPAMVHWKEIGCAPPEQLALSVMSVLGESGLA